MALMELFFRRPTPEAVVKEHGPAVLRQLRRIFGPRADIDDVYQAVFVEVIRSLPSFAGRSNLKTWVHRITLNVAYQEMRLSYRSKGHSELDEEDPALTVEGDPESAATSRQAMEQLYQALEALDPKKRIAVVLHDIEDKPLREVAEILGRPLQTVASQVRSGRAELAERLLEQAKPEGAREGRERQGGGR
ncbi:MAG: sigma-70 family RNA polymerase sigma factor [Myxococcota bacterium]